MTGDHDHVMTVAGSVPITDLGHIQPHEHILSDSSAQARALYSSEDEGLEAAGIDPAERPLLVAPIALDNLHWVQRHAMNTDNLALRDEDDAVVALSDYRAAGGSAIVDCTPRGLGRNPEGLRRVSERSGVHVVMGSGYYLATFHPRGISSMTASSIAAEILDDLTVGTTTDGVLAGIIGEIGTSWPLHPDEALVLEGAVIAQRESGRGVQVHPGRHPDAPFALVRLLESYGANLERISMSHVDRTLSGVAEMIRLAGTGVFVELDMFGLESTYYPYGHFELPNDGRRVDFLTELVAAGHEDRLLISHDLGYKSRLRRYGGAGYEHILRDVIPLMRRRGFSAQEVELITRVNPIRLLTGKTPTGAALA
jgi:phosphotriesterase-related protein